MLNKQINIFPNPTQDMLFLHTEEGNIELIEIYDMSGKLVLSKESDMPLSDMQISLISLPPEIYTVQVSIDGQQVNRLITKQ